MPLNLTTAIEAESPVLLSQTAYSISPADYARLGSDAMIVGCRSTSDIAQPAYERKLLGMEPSEITYLSDGLQVKGFLASLKP